MSAGARSAWSPLQDLGYAVFALVELGQALGGHVAPATLATDGLQHTLALLAAPLLFEGELRDLPSRLQERARRV